jgi:signal transduction histidine kinase
MRSAGGSPVARTVLIVDDNRALAENLAEILEDAGYSVQCAASCAEARQLDPFFTVALIDVRLPDGDGTELASELKRRVPGSEVILLTGFATLESATAAVRAGAWAYLIKPCSTDDLLLAVRQAARQVSLEEEKRELGRRAQVAEKLAAVGTLAAGLSHEIKNPLNAASLQLTVLERRLRRLPGESQPNLLEPLGLVQQEIRRLTRIVEEFLAFARPRVIVPAPVDLAQMVETVTRLFEGQAAEAGLTLQTRVDKVRPVSGDADLLQQASMNLVLNAIQATPAGGWVRIEVSEEADEIELSVEDSGPGISPQARAHLFEPFFTTKQLGSGLGLPQVNAVVQQHAGRILVEEGEVGGARFVMKLPPYLGA